MKEEGCFEVGGEELDQMRWLYFCLVWCDFKEETDNQHAPPKVTQWLGETKLVVEFVSEG
jgi:hypothetical protein